MLFEKERGSGFFLVRGGDIWVIRSIDLITSPPPPQLRQKWDLEGLRKESVRKIAGCDLVGG